ncbi:MAG: phosphotransferase [Lysobacterales bacterium]
MQAGNQPERESSVDAQARAQQRRDWVRDATGKSDPEIVVASADASFRSYWRVRNLPNTPIVMDAPPGREDIAPWIAIAQRLHASGLHAPGVYASDASLGFVLMEDLGDRTYLPALGAGTVDALYDEALAALLVMQRDVGCAGLPDYDRERLRQELELMPCWFIGRHLGIAPRGEETEALDAAFHALVEAALAQPQVFVHRDYHSRNLLITDTNSPGIIDFQDGVRGPIAYDLVSLLRDCYIAWPESRVDDWVEQYRERAVSAGLTNADARTFRRWFDWIGVQRHVKVLGIFCRLWYRDGKRHYLADLPRVWQYTHDVASRYAELAPLAALLERFIAERDLTRPTP